ncbi:hypothetical protein [Aliivibrio fischeri]|uniref:hypothetical protein n=1 Tax=Aliivibrio fischeri TaxID=668 RepID=UPI003F760F15
MQALYFQLTLELNKYEEKNCDLDVALLALIFGGYKILTNLNFNTKYEVGDILDSLNEVPVITMVG